MGLVKAQGSAPVAEERISRPVVFYDGACPLCRREIQHYRRISSSRDFDWVDIYREPMRVRSYGLTVQQVMARFHVLDMRGCRQTGVRAFVELWSHLPYYRWLASLVRTLRLEGLLEVAYRRWAGWRLQRRCHDRQCGVAHE